MKGREYNIEAMTKPENEKAKVLPVIVNQNSPSPLFGLSSSNK